jgi:LEA14-like dessication related protein
MGRSTFRAGTGKLTIQVDNRSEDAIKLGAVSVSVRDADGQAFPLLKGVGDAEGEVLGGSEGMGIVVPLKWTWPEAQSDFMAVVERKLIKLQVEGTAKVAGKTVKIGGPSGVAAPVLPVVLVRHVEATREGDLRSAELDFRFEVRNDNFFGIKVSSFVASVTVEGVEMATDQVLTNGEKVAANQSVILELPLEMDNESHPKKVRKLLRRGNLGYRVVGKIRYHNIEQPIELVGEIQFPEL